MSGGGLVDGRLHAYNVGMESFSSFPALSLQPENLVEEECQKLLDELYDSTFPRTDGFEEGVTTPGGASTVDTSPTNTHFGDSGEAWSEAGAVASHDSAVFENLFPIETKGHDGYDDPFDDESLIDDFFTHLPDWGCFTDELQLSPHEPSRWSSNTGQTNGNNSESNVHENAALLSPTSVLQKVPTPQETLTKESLMCLRPVWSESCLLGALMHCRRESVLSSWPEPGDDALRAGFFVGLYKMGKGISFNGPSSNRIHHVEGSQGHGVSVCQSAPECAERIGERFGRGVGLRKVIWWSSYEVQDAKQGNWELDKKFKQFRNTEIALYLIVKPEDGQLLTLEEGKLVKSADEGIIMKQQKDCGGGKRLKRSCPAVGGQLEGGNCKQAKVQSGGNACCRGRRPRGH